MNSTNSQNLIIGILVISVLYLITSDNKSCQEDLVTNYPTKFSIKNYGQDFYDKDGNKVTVTKINSKSKYYDKRGRLIDFRNIIRHKKRYYYLLHKYSRYCPDCGSLTNKQCSKCTNCTNCYTPNRDGTYNGECVPGDMNGPYFRADCAAISYGRNRSSYYDTYPYDHLYRDNTFYPPYYNGPYSLYDRRYRKDQEYDPEYTFNEDIDEWEYTPKTPAFENKLVKDTKEVKALEPVA